MREELAEALEESYGLADVAIAIFRQKVEGIENPYHYSHSYIEGFEQCRKAVLEVLND